MDIIIFSNTKNIDKIFSAVSKSKKFSVRILPAASLKKGARSIPKQTIVYADLSSFTKTEAPQIIKSLSKCDGSVFGIIDPKGMVDDVAALFHAGAGDYLGPHAVKKGIASKRIEDVLIFKQIEPQEKLKALKKDYILSGRDWKGIAPGKEYTFVFMLVELDNKSELKGAGNEYFNFITGSFKRYLEEHITPSNGRIWMWIDFGGLVIFPFDGGISNAIESGFRLMINRKLMSAEILHLDLLLSYRIAMHVGNTVYQARGQTGTIVSDSINSVFHLGQKYAKPGWFCLTEDMYHFVHPGLKSAFVPAGEYEGRSILRMKTVL